MKQNLIRVRQPEKVPCVRLLQLISFSKKNAMAIIPMIILTTAILFGQISSTVYQGYIYFITQWAMYQPLHKPLYFDTWPTVLEGVH